MGYAEESGIPYGEGFVKNRYIGRTFITPDQESREAAVRIKLGALRCQVAGKRVVMIDDSHRPGYHRQRHCQPASERRCYRSSRAHLLSRVYFPLFLRH